MCRWLAYSGSPVLLDELIYKPKHSLIDQSLHSRLGAETTNGDGFGIGWYGEGDTPGVFHSIEPAGTTATCASSPGTSSPPLVFAHIRASTGTPVQQTNCHPFRHGNWLWMHNGAIADFHDVKRDLVLAVDPSLYPDIEGSTDSEVFFYLALTFGLEDDPPAAVAARRRPHRGHRPRHGVAHPIQMTVATTNGEQHLGVSLLERGAVAFAVLQHRPRRVKMLYPETRGFKSWTRVTARGFGAPRQPRRGLERGAGVELGRRPAGSG